MSEKSTTYYRYFPSGGNADRVREVVDHDASSAMQHLGERVAAGWDVRQRYVKGQDGLTRTVTWLLTGDGHDRVWALYVSEGWK